MNNLLCEDIQFIEYGHKYYLKSDRAWKPGFSGSKISKIVFDGQFEGDKIARNLCANNPKYKAWNPQALQDSWLEGARIGTVVHKEIENYLKEGDRLWQYKARVAKPFLDELQASEDTLYPELVLYSKELSFAGMVDLLVVNKETGKGTIYDWKTNKKIDFKPFNRKDVVDFAGYSIPDCNFHHYSLQLSSYAYVLEQAYGIEIEAIKLVHLSEKDEQVKNYDRSIEYKKIISCDLIDCVDYRPAIFEILGEIK